MVTKPEISLPGCPAVVAGIRQVSWLNADGEIESLDRKTAADRLVDGVFPFVCHARATARRLEVRQFAAFDVLELFAFVRPAQFVLPTPRGLAESLGLALPNSIYAETATLPNVARKLLGELALLAGQEPDRARETACQARHRGRECIFKPFGAVAPWMESGE